MTTVLYRIIILELDGVGRIIPMSSHGLGSTLTYSDGIGVRHATYWKHSKSGNLIFREVTSG